MTKEITPMRVSVQHCRRVRRVVDCWFNTYHKDRSKDYSHLDVFLDHLALQGLGPLVEYNRLVLQRFSLSHDVIQCLSTFQNLFYSVCKARVSATVKDGPMFECMMFFTSVTWLFSARILSTLTSSE